MSSSIFICPGCSRLVDATHECPVLSFITPSKGFKVGDRFDLKTPDGVERRQIVCVTPSEEPPAPKALSIAERIAQASNPKRARSLRAKLAKQRARTVARLERLRARRAAKEAAE